MGKPSGGLRALLFWRLALCIPKAVVLLGLALGLEALSSFLHSSGFYTILCRALGVYRTSLWDFLWR